MGHPSGTVWTSDSDDELSHLNQSYIKEMSYSK